jgi:hypothetical protein
MSMAPPAASPDGYGDKVTIRLSRHSDAATTVSFGVPVARGTLSTTEGVRIMVEGKILGTANVRPLLWDYDNSGQPTSVIAMQVQFPASELRDACMDIDIVWKGSGTAAGANLVPFSTAGLSGPTPFTVDTAVRTITGSGSGNKLVEGPITTKTLFVGRAPLVFASFPEGYLAHTGILGKQVTSKEAAQPELAEMRFLSDTAPALGLAAMYAMPYPLNPDGIDNPITNYEGWLYDRCATFLTLYSHTADFRFHQHALRSCSYYADQIELSGTRSGIFKGKPDPDIKYSHLRGLYVYYALTGDEAALAAGQAIAAMWEAETTFVAPYRAGRLRGSDKLWTERLLGTSLEGLYYGHRLTGEAKYLSAMREMVDTAYRHITGDTAILAAINPGVGPFSPQNCFIHSALQHGEGDGTDPWCSGWMTELVIDPLLGYEAQTKDYRVDEIFVRLARFLRDVGSQYFRGNPLGDTFAAPAICFDPTDIENPRVLTPMYGAGLRDDGMRYDSSEYDDTEHCPDATALTSAGLRALRRMNAFDAPYAPPFASEGESLIQLHHEMTACARYVFSEKYRPRRDPSVWSSADLAPGLANPAKFISDNKIGYPNYSISPIRELSWWLNTSMLNFALLQEAGIQIPELRPGKIQPRTCP